MNDLLLYTPALLILLAMLGLSAAFSAAETALFSLSRLQLRELRRNRSGVNATIADLMDDPRGLLVLLLLNNMFINVLYASLSVRVALKMSALAGSWAPPVLFEFAAVGALILFGEVTPKAVALRLPMRIAVLTAPILKWTGRALKPVQKLFEGVVTHVSAFLLPAQPERFITEEELNQLLQMSVGSGIITPAERKVFAKVVAIRNLRIKEIMGARASVVMYRYGDDQKEMLRRAEDARQRTVPVFGETIDDILGAVKVRDLLLYPEKSVAELTEPVFFVPEQKRVDELLHEFVQTGRKFAVAVDEYGGVAGFLSIENIIEEIFGELEVDTQREEDDFLRRVEERSFEAGGSLPLRDLNEILRVDLGARGLTTLGGFVNHLAGSHPQPGAVLEHEGLRFTVLDMDGARVRSLRIDLPAPASA